MPRHPEFPPKYKISALALSSCFTFSSAHAQSFDCEKSATTVERGICSDKGLAGLDDQLANSLRKLISARPEMRATFLADEHRWLRERDRRCNSQTAPQNLFNCLTAEYSARIAEISVKMEEPINKVPASRTAICRSIIERYRPLANAHPGEAPLAVLASSTNSGIEFASPSALIWHPTADLVGWAAAQKPPFSISPDLLKSLELYEQTGGAGTLIKARGVDFYSLARTQGSMGCSDSLAFVIRGGIALPAAEPGESDNEQGSCGSGAAYATVAASPVAIEQNYDWRPGMSASLDVWTWDGQAFTASCKVSLTYKPRFTPKTLNDWGESCKGIDCDELRSASFKLAEAAETDSAALQERAIEHLTAKQRKKFEAMKQAFDAQSREPTSNDAFEIPFIHHGRLYMASVGHYAIGWRDFADWRVTFDSFDADGNLTPRGVFSVGTWKGDLDTVSVIDE